MVYDMSNNPAITYAYVCRLCDYMLAYVQDTFQRSIVCAYGTYSYQAGFIYGGFNFNDLREYRIWTVLTHSTWSIAHKWHAELRIFDELSLHLKWVTYSCSFAR